MVHRDSTQHTHFKLPPVVGSYIIKSVFTSPMAIHPPVVTKGVYFFRQWRVTSVVTKGRVFISPMAIHPTVVTKGRVFIVPMGPSTNKEGCLLHLWGFTQVVITGRVFIAPMGLLAVREGCLMHMAGHLQTLTIMTVN